MAEFAPPKTLAYTVTSKHGALVRDDVELDSGEVTTLEHGSTIRVDGSATTTTGTLRYHVVAPVVGYVSAKVVRTAKPRLAVLHGTASNASIAKAQLAALVARLSASYELVFIEASRLCSADNVQAATMRKFFGQHQVLREFARATEDARGWRTYDGVERALDEAEHAVSLRFPDDPPQALVGFSQGANFATMLAARAELAGSPIPACCLFCGARPGWTRQLPELFKNTLGTPALLVAAEKDEVVHDGPLEMAKLFASPIVLRHPEGHKPLPSVDRAALDNILNEVDAFLATHVANRP